jgi:hypothetical protein
MYIRVLLVCLLLLSPVSAKSLKMQHIATGTWGGPHINMKVTAKSAAIEYDCAHGVINGPLVLDKNGQFNLRGTHTMERGGPIRAGQEPNAQPASYSGSIKGNRMTLTLQVAGLDDETFTLEKGKPGELFKCK